MQTSRQRDLGQEILIQRFCTSVPTGSWCRDPDREISCTRDPHTEILHKRSTYKDLARGHTGSWCRDPDREILHKRSSYGDLAQQFHIQRSCTRGPTGSWCRHHDREILHKRSTCRDLAQEVLQDPDVDILTEILHKSSADRDLAQVVLQDPDADIMTERSCTRDPQRSCTSSLTEENLTQTSCTRDPHTPILHKCSYRILLRRSWHGHLAQEILIQRSCASGPRGCWRRSPDKDIMQKWYYRILMQRSWHGLGIHDF